MERTHRNLVRAAPGTRDRASPAHRDELPAASEPRVARSPAWARSRSGSRWCASRAPPGGMRSAHILASCRRLDSRHSHHLAASRSAASPHLNVERVAPRRTLAGPPQEPLSRPQTTATTPSRAPHARTHRVTATAQIRREFGTKRARAAASLPAATAWQGSTRSPASMQTTKAIASSPQARQTQAEFGFER